MEKTEIKNSGYIQDEMIVIRAAMPNPEEGVAYARFLNEAAEGFFEKMLGPKAYEIIAEAFVKPNNDYSFENAAMMEFKGNIVGMVSGFTLAEKEGFRQNILSEFSQGAGARIRMFSTTAKWLSRHMGPRKKEEFYLEAIAVSAEMRGKGLGQRMLKHTVDLALRRGAKTLALDVSSKNGKAIRSYEKFGMEITSQWPDFLKLPPVFTRMEKEI